MSKSIIVLDECEICKLSNVAAINRDYIYQRNAREIIGRNRLNKTFSKLNPTQLNKLLITHLRDHITTVAQAMSNHILQKEAVNLKNTVIETNHIIDEIDQTKKDILDKMVKVKDDNVWAKLSKVLMDGHKIRLNSVAVLHKISGKEKADEVKGAMMGTYFDTIAKKLGIDKVKELKTKARKSKKRNRADYIVEDIVDIMEDDKVLGQVIDTVEDEVTS